MSMLIEKMREEIERARAKGVVVDHWEITPEALSRLRDQAEPGALLGNEFSGEWALDGVAVKESTRPGVQDVRLVPVRPA
jgi:hypothetical protein